MNKLRARTQFTTDHNINFEAIIIRIIKKIDDNKSLIKIILNINYYKYIIIQ